MKNILLPLLFFIALPVFSQTMNEINIVPQPAEIKLNNGTFNLDRSTIIIANSSARHEAEWMNEYLKKIYGLILPIKNISPYGNIKNAILLGVLKPDERKKDEYQVSVGQNKVEIGGAGNQALFYGIQTFIQLLPLPNQGMSTATQKLSIPQLSITDYPRFAYRGMHLDVSRHFFTADVVKKFIDYLAYHKFNTFHWHLTDDQGWRIEIKKYPLLTSVGGYRNGTIIGRYPGKGNDSLYYGGFYTQQQIKEIVKYAADRYITIIPEIEMPGHSSAAIAAYPQLSCFPGESTKILASTPWAGSRNGKQVQQTWGVFDDVYCPSAFTFNFLENVLDEVMQLFPSTYIHIGGDECPKSAWKRSAFCQQLIKENKLKDEHGLQSYFIQRIEKYLNSKGRKIIGWDEILEGGLAPNATVMSWRGESGGIAAAKQHHAVIMTPQAYCYFDHSQIKNEDSVTIGGYLSPEKVYEYNPVPKELDSGRSKYILGAQGNVWTEYISNKDKLEYMIFPRMSALSEVLWSSKEKKEWKDFEIRLPHLMQRYRSWGSNYSSGYYDLVSSILPTPDFNGILWKLETKNKEGDIIYVEGPSRNATHQYTSPVLIRGNGEYGAALTRRDHSFLSSWVWQKFSFSKATGKKITLKDEPSGNWPGSGGFTLVNGVVTEKKLSQSAEWLGFLGNDLEAVIDLGTSQNIQMIRLNVLKQEGSWIYPPASVEFLTSPDGSNFTSQGILLPGANGTWINERQIEKQLKNISARFIKVIAKNYGIIPPGQPGAGTPAWLFADEMEVD